MIRSFLTITLRVLWRNKVTTLINIFSLTIGITAIILIILYVHHETSYDKFNENYDRIYRLEGDNYGRLPPIVGIYLKNNLPEVKNIARLAGGWKNIIQYKPENDPENKKEITVNTCWADSTTCKVFTFHFIQGDPETALVDPLTIVLTKSSAEKLFGNLNPMMKTVEVGGFNYRVTAIIRDVIQSHIEIDALLSMESIPKIFPDRNINNTARNSWLWSATYLLMNPVINEHRVEDKINTVLSEINDGNLFDMEFDRFHIRPLKDVYFNGAVQNLSYGLHGNMKLLQVFLAIGIFMLLLACVNYVNITTARSTIRAKEVALRRISGSSISLLRYQFVFESVILSLFSLILAFTFLQLFLPAFNKMLMTDIPVDLLKNPFVFAGISMGVIIIGMVAGFYPAIYMTSIRTVRLIKGEGVKGTKGVLFRRALMTFQFALSIIMIIGIIVNLRQLHFIRNADLGFDDEQILTVIAPGSTSEAYTLRKTFKERLLRYSDILNVSFSAGNPGSTIPTSTFVIDGIKKTSNFFLIDEDYLDVMGIKMTAGRNFSRDIPGDKASAEMNADTDSIFLSRRTGRVLVNESAVHELGLKNPVGKIIYWQDYNKEIPVEIIGVVKDFHYRSFHDKIEPLVMFSPNPMAITSIKISSANIETTIKNIRKEWETVFNQEDFSYQFLDESFNQQYKGDEQLAILIGYFTILAVIIACLGLFGLSSFMVSRRTKEIGIRKALGASVGRIYVMLSWDFLKWVFLAFLIAIPVAWFLMDYWLRDFEYHINLGVDIYFLAGLIAVFIAIFTVTWQSLMTARANPVDALRYE